MSQSEHWNQAQQEFNADQDAALLSKDLARVRAFHLKWNPVSRLMGAADAIVEAGMHKTITANTRLPLAFRKESKAWLKARNLDSWDDGELNKP